MNKPIRKVLSIMALTVDPLLNLRDSEDVARSYDLPQIEEGIYSMGRITDPIHVEERKVEGEKQPVYIVLRGNRRTWGGQNIFKRADCPADLKANLEKVECIVYSDLDEKERLQLVVDHGSQKPISRSEVVEGVWRFMRQGFSEIDIMLVLYFAIAKFTGNEKKLNEIPTSGKDRTEFLRSWLHGTVGNFIIAAAKMGEYVRQQFVLTHKDEDKLLPKGVKVEMRTSRDRIKKLSAAKSFDTAHGGWALDDRNNVIKGETFLGLIDKFKGEDAGLVEKEKTSKLSASDLEKLASNYRSAGIRKAFLIASGAKSEELKMIFKDDDRYASLDAKFDVMVKFGQEVKNEELKKFIGILLHAEPTAFEQFVISCV